MSGAKAEQIFFPDMTSGELSREIEAVLKEKGADQAWIDYAMPDLHQTFTKYARAQWVAGHKSGAAGYILPNPQD